MYEAHRIILFNTAADLEVYHKGDVVKYGMKGKVFKMLHEQLSASEDFKPVPTVETLTTWLDDGVNGRLDVSSPPLALALP